MLCLALFFLFTGISMGNGPDMDGQKNDIRERLRAFLNGQLPPEQLKISYSDLHGLYGGLEMSITGAGEVHQKAVRRSAPTPEKLSGLQIRKLAEMILRLNLFDQETPAVPALPDESRAVLKIIAGDAESIIWERFGEMKQNNRMILVRQLMQEFAWGEQKVDME